MFALLFAGCTAVTPAGEPVTRVSTDIIHEFDASPPPGAGVPAGRQHDRSVPGVWVQLRQGFTLQGSDQPLVQHAIKKYRKSPQDVESILRRGNPYIAYILHEVRQHNYPTEIVLLPFVESGYDPLAFSHGRAAGMWQFIPGTGKMFGLKQDWWYDGRRDIVASTNAALEYLGKLQQEFDGDWLLALAAYNAGSGTVRSAIRRNRKAGKPVDFWHLRLPKETSVYVPRLLAIAAIVSQPGTHGITLPPLASAPVFAEVQTGGQLDIGIAAELAGVETDALYRLNPGFNRWATHPDGPHRLLIPAAQEKTFIDNLAALPASKRIKWVRHRIARGQTLSHIARRYDTTVAVLRSTNNLAGTRIRTGRHLLVPVSARDASQYAALNRLISRSKPAGSSKLTYRVRSGDNLWNIAKKHRVSVTQMARWNRLGSGAKIKPGQKLVIWMQGDKHVRSVRYTVRSGDSLYRIAKKFNVSIADLRRWNKLENDKYLQPGQRLTLYINVTRLSSRS